MQGSVPEAAGCAGVENTDVFSHLLLAAADRSPETDQRFARALTNGFKGLGLRRE